MIIAWFDEFFTQKIGNETIYETRTIVQRSVGEFLIFKPVNVKKQIITGANIQMHLYHSQCFSPIISRNESEVNHPWWKTS